ncbi:hypothetical protein BDV41DRAFT_529938 [Aspergillus transmontanensis]|uniref:Uncharacterized protein n=1 Tax=Aspergillus transmontanensis TaxID=1034304 RepID=A0A5N6W8M8_9EURO|nr:hypothetical protein BDV41DRAFT_529938 [Aspergillus transmontanensis]
MVPYQAACSCSRDAQTKSTPRHSGQYCHTCSTHGEKATSCRYTRTQRLSKRNPRSTPTIPPNHREEQEISWKILVTHRRVKIQSSDEAETGKGRQCFSFLH